MPPRSRRLRLEDILTAAKRIVTYTEGMSEPQLRSDTKTIDAVIRNFEIIGEAARQMDEPFISAHPEIAWAEIRGFRNVLAHDYFGIDEQVLWQAVQRDIPALVEQVAALLAQEPA